MQHAGSSICACKDVMGDKCSCGKTKEIKYPSCAACFGKKSHNGHNKFKSTKQNNAMETMTAPSMIHTSQLINVLFLYTDGSCIGNSNVANRVCPAGWGVVITKPDLILGDKLIDVLSFEKSAEQCILLDELYGPVVMDSTSPYYLHATVASNNTSELSAIGEALIWLLHYNPMNVEPHRPRQTAFIRYDSEYAAKSVQGIFKGPKNVELIKHIRTIYQTVCKYYEVVFLHVKGHSGHRYNDRADVLANLGNKGNFCSSGRFAAEAVTYTCNSSSNASTSSSSHGNNATNSVTGHTSHTNNNTYNNHNIKQSSLIGNVVVQIPASRFATLPLPSTDSLADRVMPTPRPALSITSSSKSSTIRPTSTLPNGTVLTAGCVSVAAKKIFAPKIATISGKVPADPTNNYINSASSTHKSNAIDLTITTPSSPFSGISSSDHRAAAKNEFSGGSKSNTSCGVKRRDVIEFSSSEDEGGDDDRRKGLKVSRLC